MKDVSGVDVSGVGIWSVLTVDLSGNDVPEMEVDTPVTVTDDESDWIPLRVPFTESAVARAMKAPLKSTAM